MGYNKAEEGLSAIQTLLVSFSYAMLIFCGIWREIVDKFFGVFATKPSYKVKGYAPLMVEYDRFFVTRMYQPVGDSFDRPITGTPGTFTDVLERKGINGNSSYSFTGNKMKCLNLGSYNYLGFALNSVVDKYNVSNCGSILEGGYTLVHKELEESIAEFVGKESAIIFEMGYATNSTTIPALVKKGALVVSDSLNHASLVMGLRASGAHVAVFNHNDTIDLERVIRRSISKGQPATGEPYSMILIVVEGIYSMEGIICQLPEIVRIKKKYKAYLYVDEAHSIGALGKRGRGVCDYFNVNPNDVDILMGTFTKSFASIGGYVAGSKDLIARLRASSFGITYANSMSVVCAQQSLSALRVITGKDGTDTGAKRLLQLKENCNYFRSRLRQMGFLILGNNDSPIIPLMLYYPGKVSYFSRQLLARGVAVVVVGYPATPLLTARARFCISAGHTKEDLEYALKAIEDVGAQCGINY